MKSQKGFGVIEIILALFLLGAVSLIGYQAYKTRAATVVLDSEYEEIEEDLHELADEVPEVPKIEKASDIVKVETALDDLNFDSVIDESNKLQ
jgi:prepilin-type N-terminal cleavage/methylation domain-containing protein